MVHGIEEIESKTGPVPVIVVLSGVIGLLGIAPKGPKNSLTLVKSPDDAAQFGSQLPGFNIPQAIAHIQAQGAGTIVVANVFDPATHVLAVAAETVNTTAGKGALAFAPIGTAPVVKDSAAVTTYTAGTDYTIDDFGNIVILNRTTITDGSTLKVTYNKLDASAITSSLLIGGIDNSNNRTGLACFDLCYSTFGFKAKIFIAPGYSSLSAVAAALTVAANKFKGQAPISAPAGTTLSVALAGRGPSGTINFNTSDARTILLYPQVKKANPNPAAASGSTLLAPLDAFFAGVMAATDAAEGYHVSPSNHNIQNVLGMEVPLSADILDPNCDVNTLNGAGIVSIFNNFGTGYRVWGNRNSSFPADSSPNTFIPVRRTFDVVEESIAYAMMPFIDKPITQPIIDAILDTVNNFIRVLIGRGALIAGSQCLFLAAKNPALQIAAGKLYFTNRLMSPTPLEDTEFDTFMDVSLLASLVSPSN